VLQARHGIRRQAPPAAERVLAIARSEYVLDVRDDFGAERLESRVRTGRAGQEAPAPRVRPFQVGNRPSASSPSGALKASAMLRTSDLSPLAAFFLASSMFTSPSALSILNQP
jgi:hypothetical protein